MIEKKNIARDICLDYIQPYARTWKKFWIIWNSIKKSSAAKIRLYNNEWYSNKVLFALENQTDKLEMYETEDKSDWTIFSIL